MKRQLAFVVLLSLALHGLGFGAFYDHEDVSVQGGAPVAEARLGNSFADMVSGVSTPVTPDTADEVTPENTPPVEAVEAASTAEPVPSATVTASAMAPAETPTEAVPSPSPIVEHGLVVAPRTEAVRPTTTPSNKIAALTPQATPSDSPEPERTETTEAEPTVPSAEPVRPIETEPPETTEQIVGQTPIVVQQADANTERPKARPDRRQRAETPARPAPQGSSTQDATRGTSTGSRDATSSSASSSNRGASQQGNSAAATNYPGRVWSKLQGGRRSSSAGRGTAVVSFRIAANGGLAGLDIARSSGNARLDQAALRHVRRAAPFPPPPPGARTSFNFSYEVQ
ncbi:MAG: TonB family protein [Pseudomonadota bacterium]